MSARVRWLVLRLAFGVGFALFALAMLGVLPDIFLLVGFGVYLIAVPFWLYPRERLFPHEELEAMAKWDAADIADATLVPFGIDAANPTSGAVKAGDKSPKDPQPPSSAGHRTDHPRRLHVPYVAMVAARIVPHRWRGGQR